MSKRMVLRPRTTYNVLEFTAIQKKSFLKSFDMVLICCEGVLYRYAETIANSGAGVQELKSQGKDIKFITSNSMLNCQQHIELLRGVGVKDVKESDIIHPGECLLKYLTHYMKKNSYVFSLCSNQLNNHLTANGIEVETMEPFTYITSNNFEENIVPPDKVDAVVMDNNFELTYCQLARAAMYLQKGNCAFLVGAADEMLPIHKEFSVLGSSGFVSMLQEHTGVEPEILGKPGRRLQRYLAHEIRLSDSNRILFVGSDIRTDIWFGKHCNFSTLLVLTGVSKATELKGVDDDYKPNYIVSSMADIVGLFR